MGKRSAHTMTRRCFLRKGATLGAGAASAGVLGGFGLGALGLSEERATALTLDEARHATYAHAEKPAPSSLAAMSKQGVSCRLGILSDLHICATDDAATNKLSQALATLGWATPEIDAFFILGDVTYQGAEEELAAFATLITEELFTHFSSVPALHLLMGNHDYHTGSEASFESYFAQHTPASLFIAAQNTVALLPGATVIKLNGAGSAAVDKMDYTVSYEFLAKALAEAASNRPDDAILIMAHEPPEHMSLPLEIECGYFGQGTDLDMIELIARYPKARMFSGHLHNPLDIPESINQDLGFTSVHTSTVGSCFFVRNEQVDYNQDGSHGLVLDLREDGSLLLHRIDFADEQYLGEPVVI